MRIRAWPPPSSAGACGAPDTPAGLTILRDHLARVRPAFAAARAFQRTSYPPGEIVQLVWWHTGMRIDVGKGVRREAFGLVASLPPSGAHAVDSAWTAAWPTSPPPCPAV